MKIKDYIGTDSPGYQNASLVVRELIEIVHKLQIDVESLMAGVTANTVSRSKKGYQTPAGLFSTKTMAWRANNITLYMLNKHLKDLNNDAYSIVVDG